MRIISRYSTQLKAEADLRYRGKGEVVYLESPDYPKHGWALVDKYEPKPFPPRGPAFVCREEDIG